MNQICNKINIVNYDIAALSYGFGGTGIGLEPKTGPKNGIQKACIVMHFNQIKFVAKITNNRNHQEIYI